MRKNKLYTLYLKIVRAEGSPECIARGVAVGLTIGLVLPIGTQTLPALALAFLLKANKVLSWTFTCVSNPASVFILYPFQCWVGSYLVFKPLSLDSFSSRFSALAEASTLSETFRELGALGADVMIPFFAGGVFFAVICAPLGYVVSRRLVLAYHRRKERLRQLRQKKAEEARRSRSGENGGSAGL